MGEFDHAFTCHAFTSVRCCSWNCGSSGCSGPRDCKGPGLMQNGSLFGSRLDGYHGDNGGNLRSPQGFRLYGQDRSAVRASDLHIHEEQKDRRVPGKLDADDGS